MIPYSTHSSSTASSAKLLADPGAGNRLRNCVEHNGKPKTCHLILMVLAICISILLPACEQKDLVRFSGEMCLVDVRFLWDSAETASPEGMSLFFYPENKNGKFWRFDIAGKEGGLIEIEEGAYTMIAVNNDLSGITLEDMSVLSSAQAVQAVLESSPYLLPSGILYRTRIEKLVVTTQGISYASPTGDIIHSTASELECFPDSASVVYKVMVEEVSGIDRVRSAEAILKGCAGGIYLESLYPLAPNDPLAFPLDTDVEKKSFSGSSTGFRCADKYPDYELTLRLKYFDGGVYEKKFNFNSKDINSSDTHTVYIVIKDLKLPGNAPLDPDAVGIGVGMDGWKLVEINLDSETI